MSTVTAAMFDRHNVTRSARSLPLFVWNPLLANAASNHSFRLAYTPGLGSTDPHSQWVQEIEAAGYAYSAIGQNVAMNGGTVNQVYQTWLNSPPHLANIVTARFIRLGCAVSSGPQGTWWTVNFADPA